MSDSTPPPDGWPAEMQKSLCRIDELESIEADFAKVVEDLHLHQEELRVQNEDLRQAQEGLAEASRRYQDLFDFAPVAYFLLDDKGAIVEANFTACQLLGEQRVGLVQRPMRLYVTADTRQRFDLFLIEAAAGRQSGSLEATLQCRGKQGPPVQFTLVVDRNGRALRYRLAAVDITERQQAEEQKRLAAIMFEESSEGMLITDPEANILRVNRAFTVVTGYTQDEVVGKKPSLLASGRHDVGFYKAMYDRLNQQGSWMGEIWNKRKNGEIYPEWLKINVVRGGQSQMRHFVGIFSDIGDHKNSGVEVERFAFYDPLTDLPNRTLFVERLKHALIHAHRDGLGAALLYLDLDRFKSVNDTLGHQVGDLLLQQVAQRLCQLVRVYDTVSRLGGDEFTVVLADMASPAEAIETAERVAENIREQLARPFYVGGHEVVTGSSIGIALYPQDGETYSDLVKHADIAMYHAKRNNGNGHAFFSNEMNSRVVRRVQMETALRNAVRRQELSLAYQPVVDAVKQRVVGVEALLRWESPDGPVSPLEFIPVLEDLGLGHDVARWVLATASQEVQGWEFDAAESIWLSINFSPLQLHRILIAWVEEALQQSGMPASRLMVEVTEDHFRHNAEAIVACLDAIRELGARVALDDFGTGHSSLGRLRNFPIDLVKIDRSFVNGLPHDAKDLAIVNTIIAMARHLGMEFLAEGVESHGQLELLKAQGCGLIQGFVFAQPMSGNDCAQWCADFHQRRQ